MDIYKVSDEYIDRLRSVDDTVLFNKPAGEQRPYCGSIATINERNYFIPMSSPKEKKMSTQISIKILDDNDDHLGNLRFHNMIPVPKSELEKLNINHIRNYTNQHYGTLLLKEYLFLNNNEERIQDKAQKVYTNKIRGNSEFFNHFCCDYDRLELEHDLFVTEKNDQRRQLLNHKRTLSGLDR